jgi:hypothetical protein
MLTHGGTQEVTMDLMLWGRLLQLLLLDDSLHGTGLRGALGLQSGTLLLAVSLHGGGEPLGVLHGRLWSDKLLDWLLLLLSMLLLARLLLLLLGIQYELRQTSCGLTLTLV